MFFVDEVVSDLPKCKDFVELESLLSSGLFILVSERNLAFQNGNLFVAKLEDLCSISLEIPNDLENAPYNPVNAANWVFLCSKLGDKEQANYFGIAVNKDKFPDLEFRGIRSLFGEAPSFLGNIGAKAVSLLDWRRKNQYSPRTGTKVLVESLGTRLKDDKYSIYPRINPVVITLVVSQCGNFCLLGRGHRYRKEMYSCLAGFAEYGETLEQASAREVLEESALNIRDVQIWRSQPWPCSQRGYELMIGMIGTADMSEQIVIQKSELADVKWFSREEVKAMLRRNRLSQKGPFVPGPYAIAHHLIQHFASGACNVRKSSESRFPISFRSFTLGVSIGVAVGATLFKTYQRANL